MGGCFASTTKRHKTVFLVVKSYKMWVSGGVAYLVPCLQVYYTLFSCSLLGPSTGPQNFEATCHDPRGLAASRRLEDRLVRRLDEQLELERRPLFSYLWGSCCGYPCNKSGAILDLVVRPLVIGNSHSSLFL